MALPLTCYNTGHVNTGARAQELLDMRAGDLQLEPPRQVLLRGRDASSGSARYGTRQANAGGQLRVGHATLQRQLAQDCALRVAQWFRLIWFDRRNLPFLAQI